MKVTTKIFFGRKIMKEFTKALEGLPFIVKLIFCIPALDIIWSVYKLLKGIESGDVLKIVLGVLTIVPGAFFMWILDIIWVILKGKPFWFND